MEFVELTSELFALFRFTLANNKNIVVRLQEKILTSLMYTNTHFYKRLGECFCVAYNVGLAKGGSDAIVESIYSVMKTQSHQGNQANQVLVDRTSIDWHCPPSPLAIMDLIAEAAKLHQENHFPPVSKVNFGLSKVMQRMKGDRGRIQPELLLLAAAPQGLMGCVTGVCKLC